MILLNEATTLEKQLLRRATEGRKPICGSLELLPLCNMNCAMCYVKLSYEEMQQQGGFRTVEEWLTLAQEMKAKGVLFLLLTGGEVLLYPDFKKLYLELQQMGFIITINTNGTLLNEEWADFFAKNKPRRINITLYGADKKAYKELCGYSKGFSKAVRAIELLKKSNVEVKIGGSLTRANATEAKDIIEIGKRLEVPVTIDTYMMPTVREGVLPYEQQSRLNPVIAARYRVEVLKQEMGTKLFKRYVSQVLRVVNQATKEEKPEPMSCYAGHCSFAVTWQGNMRPCVIMSEPSVNVFDVGFGEAWKQISEQCSHIFLNAKCSACKLRCLCRTCAASALLETGDYMGVPEYMCEYAKASLAAIEEEAKELGL